MSVERRRDHILEWLIGKKKAFLELDEEGTDEPAGTPSANLRRRVPSLRRKNDEDR